MKRVSVLLDDDDLARLRHLQQITGHHQSDVLRAGLRALVGESGERPQPRSLGLGAWLFKGTDRWDAEPAAPEPSTEDSDTGQAVSSS